MSSLGPEAIVMEQPTTILSKPILGVQISTTSYTDACDRIQHWAKNSTSCYVVAANVHVIMSAYWDRAYLKVLDRAALITPDGMPLVWGLRLMGFPGQQRVYGPDLMLAWCERAAHLGFPIYLYGGTKSMLQKLSESLTEKFPGLQIAGSHAPPFHTLTPEEEADDIERIHRSGARVVFVGLGCPKQEYWMSRQQGQLQAVMIGVGAAFSFFSGEVSQAPRWMMRLGLEWLYRFGQEPGRLWRRYLITNPAFVVLFGWQLLQERLGRDPVKKPL